MSNSLRLHESQHARPPCPSPTPRVVMDQSSPKLMCIKSVKSFSLCHPLLLLPPIPPSIRGFSNESTLHMRWPKYCSFSFSIIPSKEHQGLISFRMDWLDLLAVQGTLKSPWTPNTATPTLVILSCSLLEVTSSIPLCHHDYVYQV